MLLLPDTCLSITSFTCSSSIILIQWNAGGAWVGSTICNYTEWQLQFIDPLICTIQKKKRKDLFRECSLSLSWSWNEQNRELQKIRGQSSLHTKINANFIVEVSEPDCFSPSQRLVHWAMQLNNCHQYWSWTEYFSSSTHRQKR